MSMGADPAGYGPPVNRRCALVGTDTVATALLLTLGAATLIGSQTSHRSMMDHVTAEAAETSPSGGDHGGEQHPGMGVHLAGACTAILAAALVVLGLRGRFGTAAVATEHLARRPGQAEVVDVVHVAGIGPPRLALCVDLR
jgi:hypothetical protein